MRHLTDYAPNMKLAAPCLLMVVFIGACTSEPPRMHADIDVVPAAYPALPSPHWTPVTVPPSDTVADVPHEVIGAPSAEGLIALTSISGSQDETLDPPGGEELALARIAFADGRSEDAILALHEAALLDNAIAHYELARLYTEGTVTARNLERASQHLHASADLGNAEAERVIAWEMIRGDLGAADVSGGLTAMAKAAPRSVRAQRELGMLYAGRYPYNVNDPAKAEQYLAQAYQAGDSEAAYELGALLSKQGDNLQAITPLSFAASAGNRDAGALLQKMEGEPEVNPVPTAVAAENLYQRANALLLGSNRDLKKEARAYALFTLAAEQGSSAAVDDIRALEGVKLMMDAQDRGWLEQYREEARSGL